MTVLDTFFILFKSNSDEAIAATKKVENAVAAVKNADAELLKAQDESSKKTTKNAADQEKQILSLQQKKKAAMQEQRAAEKEQERIDKERLNTGNEFVNLLEKTATAAAAYFSAKAIAGGVFNAAQNNAALKSEGDLLGQNIEKIKALDAAGRAFGGKEGAIFANYSDVFHDLTSKGLKAPDEEGYLRFLRRQLKLPQFQGKEGADRFFQSLPQPITDVGEKRLLTASDADFEKELNLQKRLAANQEVSATQAQELNKALSETKTLIDSIFTQIGAKFIPLITGVNKFLVSANDVLFDHEGARINQDSEWSKTHGGQKSPFLPTPGGTKDSVAFWISQGYPADVAAGIAANEQRESGGNPGAIGDNGAARGLYQWHPDRVAKIKAGIGIDVTSANADDQRRAAAWEIEQMGLKDSLINSGGAYNSASLFSRRFERPANGDYEAIIRGQEALRIASTSSFGMSGGDTSSSKTINVKIGDVNVNAQGNNSTDIARNTAGELVKQLRDAIANTDDGIAM
jgi:hypothetical protein